MTNKTDQSRRRFISNSALAAIGTIGAAQLLTSCKDGNSKKKEIKLPELLNQAPDGKVLKAGLIGCGGRGTGAAINFLDAGPNLQIVALGDVFQDRLDKCRAELKTQKNVEIADEKCFLGFDSYEKVIDSGVDVVLAMHSSSFSSPACRSSCKSRQAYLHGETMCSRSCWCKISNGLFRTCQTKRSLHGKRHYPEETERFHGNTEKSGKR